jgi:hypothetical protein
MISKRTVERWRSESLIEIKKYSDSKIVDSISITKQLHERIIRLTQDILDKYLLERSKS